MTDTSPTIISKELKAARSSSLLVFLVCGIALSCWAPMVPFAKTKLQLDEATLGLVLLSLGAGAILTMPFTGILIKKFGPRKVIVTASTVVSIMLPLLLLSNSAIQLAIALFIFGSALGSVDVSMNAHAVLVQNLYGKHIMSSFHGMFSLGGLLGSIGLGFLIKFGLSPFVAAVSIGLLLFLIVVSQYRNLLPDTEEDTEDSFSFTLPRGRVLVLGFMCFAFFLAEGALLDWSAVFLQFNRNFDPSFSGVGYAAFSLAMAIMRLTGDGIVHKLGSQKVVQYGALVAAAGYFIATAIPSPVAAIAGFVMVGLGAANVVPVFFTAAGNVPNVPASISLPAVTTLGYTGQLAGPAAIGVIAELSSLPFALGLVGLLLLIVAFTYKDH